MALLQTYGNYPKFKYAFVKITFVFGDKRRRDIGDNYNGKEICDGLVKAGILEDDRYDYIGVPMLRAGYDKGNPHTIIEVWEKEGDI